MKVITQLIRHFWQRGALTPEQAEYLLDMGFARLADLPGYQPPVHVEPPRPEPIILPPHPLEHIADRLEQPPRRRGGGGPKGVVPEASDLQLWLRKQFARRARHWPALVALASRFTRCADWRDAAVIIRQQRPDRFVKGLLASLRTGQIGLRNLWLAVDPEPFHARMEDDSLRGPTVRAFRMLLALRSASQLGRYVWILKLHEVQAAQNLLMVHRQLLAALGALFHQHRPTLNAALAQSTHPAPQWGLLLLHNAQRHHTADGQPTSREYGPLAPPDDSVWRQAWSGALVMDPQPIATFLVRCFGRTRAGEIQACNEPLFCPKEWKLGSSKTLSHR